MSGVLLLRGTEASKIEAIVLENIWFFDEKGKTEGESYRSIKTFGLGVENDRSIDASRFWHEMLCLNALFIHSNHTFVFYHGNLTLLTITPQICSCQHHLNHHNLLHVCMYLVLFAYNLRFIYVFIKRRLFVRFLQIQILRELSERAELFWPTQIK